MNYHNLQEDLESLKDALVNFGSLVVKTDEEELSTSGILDNNALHIRSVETLIEKAAYLTDALRSAERDVENLAVKADDLHGLVNLRESERDAAEALMRDLSHKNEQLQATVFTLEKAVGKTQEAPEDSEERGAADSGRAAEGGRAAGA